MVVPSASVFGSEPKEQNSAYGPLPTPILFLANETKAMRPEQKQDPAQMTKEEFLGAVDLLSPNVDVSIVSAAYDYGERAHEGQLRTSGDPYFTHSMAVALSLAEWHQDSLTIGAGLIHDVVEDTISTSEDIKGEFGPEMAQIVDGVTKISTQFVFTSTEAKQAENFRKMLVSMARDIRVILVKFADRLHNMRTLGHLSEAKRERIALETREIYAPLAHRLGMAKVRWELEDLAMKYLEGEAYRMVAEKVQAKREEREVLIDSVRDPLTERIADAKIDATIVGRPKHFYSIYRKMLSRDKPFEEIYDLLAIRVVTDSVEHCYHILGIVHSLWKPLNDRFKDYVATPKSNMYQSLHTTVAGDSGDLIEIQIRTDAMDQTAEEGIAAHWLYKEEGESNADEEQFVWLRQLMENQKDLSDPREFMESLKIDLFQEECFVFTPKGDLLRLPRGATPIDFAFAIHTEVGMHCAGAKVNGRFSTLTTALKSGDMVEVVTSAQQRPSRDWLNAVKTSRARVKIRQALRRAARKQSIVIGRQIFERDARKRRVSIGYTKKFSETLATLGFDSVDDLFVAIADGEASSSYVLNRLDPEKKESRALPPAVLDRIIDRTRRVKGVRIDEVDDVLTRLAECCQPVPGDRVFGYITRGRGLTIHRVDCPNSFALGDSERRIDVHWAVEGDERFVVDVTVVGSDRANLLLDLTKVISKMGINLRGSTMKAEGGEVEGRFVMEIANGTQLNKILKDLTRVKGVTSVYRRSSGIEDSRRRR